MVEIWDFNLSVEMNADAANETDDGQDDNYND